MPLRLLWACLLTLLFLPSPAYCQTETLSGFLQTHLGKNALIVIEGERDISGQRSALKAIIDQNRNPSVCIDAIAQACDYEVVRFSGAYLLRKRYTDPFELPCVSEEEIASYIKAISPLVNGDMLDGTTNHDSVSLLRSLLQSLSEADWKRIQREPIPTSELNPSSKTVLTQLLKETYLGALQAYLKTASQQITVRNESVLRLAKEDTGSVYLLWQTFTKGKPNPFHAILPDGISGIPNTETKMKYEALNASCGGSDIEDVLQRLNRGSNNHTIFKASPELLHKPVSVSGVTSTNAVQVVHAIAKLYDLRVTTMTSSTRLSSKQRVYQPNQKLGEYLFSTLPLPLRRTIAHSHDSASKQVLLSLLPDVQKVKLEPKEIGYTDLRPVYRMALLLNVFSKVLEEIRDDDMDRLTPYLHQIDHLYLKYGAPPGQPSIFSIQFERDGVLVNGPQYTIYGKPPRE